MTGRVTHGRVFKAILFAALSSPCVAQGCHNGHGGSQNQPPAASPMIAAVPWAAMAAVKRQMSDARSSWSFSERKRSQNSSGIFGYRTFLDNRFYVAGTDLQTATKRRVRMSKFFIVVGREKALKSEWVVKEVHRSLLSYISALPNGSARFPP